MNYIKNFFLPKKNYVYKIIKLNMGYFKYEYYE
jgi:hypothetical protein